MKFTFRENEDGDITVNEATVFIKYMLDGDDFPVLNKDVFKIMKNDILYMAGKYPHPVLTIVTEKGTQLWNGSTFIPPMHGMELFTDSFEAYTSYLSTKYED